MAPTLMNVPDADGSRYVSSSAVVATASVPAAKKPSATSSVVRYPARGRDRANAAIVTGTRKLPTMITVGTRTLSLVTCVITAANTHASHAAGEQQLPQPRRQMHEMLVRLHGARHGLRRELAHGTRDRVQPPASRPPGRGIIRNG